MLAAASQAATSSGASITGVAQHTVMFGPISVNIVSRGLRGVSCAVQAASCSRGRGGAQRSTTLATSNSGLRSAPPPMSSLLGQHLCRTSSETGRA